MILRVSFFNGFHERNQLYCHIPIRIKSNAESGFNKQKHITANIISLTGLLCREFLQTKTSKGHFDWNDVLWTFMGAFVFQLIWTITPEKYKKKYNET